MYKTIYITINYKNRNVSDNFLLSQGLKMYFRILLNNTVDANVVTPYNETKQNSMNFLMNISI